MDQVWTLLKKFIRDQLTENDGVSYCLGRFLGASAGATACYKFWTVATPDYVGFGACIAAIITAIAAKNWTEQGK